MEHRLKRRKISDLATGESDNAVACQHTRRSRTQATAGSNIPVTRRSNSQILTIDERIIDPQAASHLRDRRSPSPNLSVSDAVGVGTPSVVDLHPVADRLQVANQQPKPPSASPRWPTAQPTPQPRSQSLRQPPPPPLSLQPPPPRLSTAVPPPKDDDHSPHGDHPHNRPHPFDNDPATEPHSPPRPPILPSITVTSGNGIGPSSQIILAPPSSPLPISPLPTLIHSKSSSDASAASRSARPTASPSAFSTVHKTGSASVGASAAASPSASPSPSTSASAAAAASAVARNGHSSYDSVVAAAAFTTALESAASASQTLVSALATVVVSCSSVISTDSLTTTSESPTATTDGRDQHTYLSDYSTDAPGVIATGAPSNIGTAVGPQPSSSGGNGKINDSPPSDGGGGGATPPQLVGGIVGGVAGLAAILIFVILVLKWYKRRHANITTTFLSPRGLNSQGTSVGTVSGIGAMASSRDLRSASTKPPYMAERAGAAAAAASTVASVFHRLSQPDGSKRQAPSGTAVPASGRRFERITGRKLPSAFSAAATSEDYEGVGRHEHARRPDDTYNQRQPVQARAGPESLNVAGVSHFPSASATTSAPAPATGPATATAVAAAGDPSPLDTVVPAEWRPIAPGNGTRPGSSRAEALRPSPARTPVVRSPARAPAPFLGPTASSSVINLGIAHAQHGSLSRSQVSLTGSAAGTGRPPAHVAGDETPPGTSWLSRPGTLGRSHPSMDGSRGSRFTEDV